MPTFELDPADAIEIAELLQFLANWLAADPEHLTDSFTNYLGAPGYDLDQLRNDLNRFAFLLGGEPLFQP